MTVKRSMILIALWAGGLIFASGPVPAQSSPNYAVKPYVISGGGNKTTSLNYTLLSTLGQSSPIGLSTSDSYIHQAGFWPTLRLSRMLFLPLILGE